MDRRFEGWWARRGARSCALLLACSGLALSLSSAAGTRAKQPRQETGESAARRAALKNYRGLPLAFVPNAGQLDGPVRYSAQAGRAGFFFTRREAVFSFAGKEQGLALRLRFLGADRQVRIAGERRASGRVNYLIGSDPQGWRTKLPSYSGLVYRELWPGIDLRFRGEQGELKYELVVKPGAEVGDIALAYRGAKRLSLDRRGNLRLDTALGTLLDSRPVGYQELGGRRITVGSRFRLGAGGDAYSFAVASYDRRRPLVLSLGLLYSTYLGGSSSASGHGIAVDGAGRAYVTGSTSSANFPTTEGAFDTGFNGRSDTFVTKLNAAGSGLLYATYLGGGGDDSGYEIAVDGAGGAYVTGQTWSSSFPTTAGAFDRSLTGGGDAFLAKLNAAGSALRYSTYLGGSAAHEWGGGIALDSAGGAYVTGRTESANFPTTAGAFDPSFNGGGEFGGDAFLTKLNAAGSALLYSTYLGGSLNDAGGGIAVDGAGHAYVTGQTASTNYPTTAGAFDIAHNGRSDAFVTKLNAAGSALLYSTYLGGSDFDYGGGIAVDGAGGAYVTGTASASFPTTAGAFDPSFNGGDEFGGDAFLAKVNAAGSALLYSTYLGGSRNDSVGGIAVDGAGGAYVTGTASANFPTTAGAFDRSLSGRDAFLAKLNAAGSALLYSTYLGGSAGDGADGIAVDGAGRAYVTGSTSSANFPATAGAFDRSLNGVGDAFVTKLNATGSALLHSTYLGARPQCQVPRVIGLRLARARQRIRAHSCRVGRVRRARSRRVGRVLTQRPRGGAVRPRNWPVNLVVGRR